MYVHNYRKEVFNQTQHFVHLNLSIALLLGLIIFVSGIETANKYRVSDKILLQRYVDLIFVPLGKLSNCGYTASLFLYVSILLDVQ